MHCASCRADNPESHRFCGHCGARLEAPEATLGERRQLTIMFCDLVGSTPLAERLDPEDLTTVVGAFQEACSNEIRRLEGQVAQLLGDGVLAYFGYPLAQEDAPVRAVDAALNVLDGVPALNARLVQAVPELRRRPLDVRIAVHTGPVVISDIGGAGRRERLALGDSANVAARLQGLAEGDSVLVSEATRSLLGGSYELEDLGPTPLRGVSKPIGVYRVLGRGIARSRLEHAAEGGLTPIVGRSQELELLLDRWERVGEEGAGKGRPGPAPGGNAVLLRGESGMGKSRLLYELRRRLMERPHVWLEGRCSPYHRNSAFHPVIQILEHVLEVDADDLPEDRLLKLERALGSGSVAEDGSAEARGLLATLLSIPLPAGEDLPALSPEATRQGTIEALLDWPLSAAQQGPVVVVIEDVHWIDPSTLELLGRFLERLPHARVLLLMTARPEFESPWVGRSEVTQLGLHPLTRQQMAEMAGSVAGGELPQDVLQQVVSRTDGVPLFVEELTKTLLESEQLTRLHDEGRYELSGSLQELEIPTTLQDSLMARLDRLNAPKQIAQLAAVIGREFSFELLEAVAATPDLGSAVDSLVAAGLLYRGGTEARPVYTFKHALMQATAYRSLLRSRRRQVHGRIAGVLEDRFPEQAEQHPSELARHWEEAGEADRAAEYRLRAGERATARCENVEAIGHLRRGIELSSRLGPGSERDELELRLQVALGTPLMSARGQSHAEVERAFGRALELSNQIGGSEGPQMPQALWGLARFYQSQGQLETASELGDQLLALAERSGDASVLPWAHLSLGLTAYWRGEPLRAVDQLERALALHDPEIHGPQTHAWGQDLDATARSFAGVALWMVGRPEQALEQSERATERGRESAHPLSHAYALDYAAALHSMRGEPARALACAEEAVQVASKSAFPLWLAFARVMRAWARGALEPGSDAVDGLRAALGELSGTGAALGAPFILGLLAQAQLQGESLDDAVATLDAALGMSRAQQSPFWDAELLRLKGEALLRLSGGAVAGTAQSAAGTAQSVAGTAQSVEALLRESLELARKQGARSLELRTAVSLGRLLASRAAQSEAVQLLTPLVGAFESSGEGRSSRDVREAQQLLAGLS